MDVVPPWTLPSLVAYFITLTWLAWCMFYMVLWGLYQPRPVVISFLQAWALTMGLSLLLLEPLTKLILLFAAVVVWPALAPLLLWIPVLGPALSSALTAADPSSGGNALSGRMAHLTLIRAAGYASSLTPDAAVIAYAANALMASVVGAVDVTGGSRSAEQSVGSGHGRGGLDEQLRYELIVRRYLLFQLQAAAAGAQASSQLKPPNSLRVLKTAPSRCLSRNVYSSSDDSDEPSPASHRFLSARAASFPPHNTAASSRDTSAPSLVFTSQQSGSGRHINLDAPLHFTARIAGAAAVPSYESREFQR